MLISFTCSHGIARPQSETDGEAGAEIIDPLMIMAWEEMEFGSIAPDPQEAGTVTLTTAGVRTCTANLTCLATPRAGKFSVTGQADATYSISLPNSITINNGPASMLVDDLSPSHTIGVLAEGYDEFMVGGILHVAGNQTPGAYIGAYTVTVEYQ